uniref:Very-long-chain enoyl-CoA reductase n=1 Tax=Acanthochromis polyacanthus TaxID=80966 RepID=A0A3Q1ETK7_9TELE
MKHYEVEILDAKTKDKLCFLDKVEPNATIGEIKSMFHKSHPQWYPARQSIRLDPKGKSLKDEDVLQHLPVGTTATFYFRDLGAQISWVTVFLTEYTGPLVIYLMFYFRVPFIYAPKYDFTTSKHWVVHLACMCHSFHYVKRLLETLFVHRFSHGTMPLRNIFKNCTYYWGFAAWMAYYINHPLYTPPIYGEQQIRLALIIFLFCQIGNFSIHVALRNLRPPGKHTFSSVYPFLAQTHSCTCVTVVNFNHISSNYLFFPFLLLREGTRAGRCGKNHISQYGLFYITITMYIMICHSKVCFQLFSEKFDKNFISYLRRPGCPLLHVGPLEPKM